MIKNLKIYAFKSIKDLEFDCSALNLFVGTNSSGKSSCLQALLLYEQNLKMRAGLNGNYISLGEFREIRNNYMPREDIRIQLDGNNVDGEEFTDGLRLTETEDGYETVREFDPKKVNKPCGPESESQFYTEFHYLSCHRIGALDIYQRNVNHYSKFGSNGEFALDYLLDHGTDLVGEELCEDSENISRTLLDQVNYWLKYIIGTELSLREIQKTNCLQVTYNNNPANSNSDAMYRRPVNIGSGVSYLISIIIACLGSCENSLIIMENPEIHLHPKAQARLTELLYRTACSGRQLFVETHSDHIFDGLRVGISSRGWQQDKIRVNFLAMSKDYETCCNPIRFGEFGKIWGENPDMNLKDLFDQFEIDLDLMLGI